MIMTKRFIYIACMLGLVFVSVAKADDLIDIYKQALANDPTFKAEESNLMAVRENLPIKRSYLLPNISAIGSVNRTYNVNDSSITDPTTNRFYDQPVNYSLSITQPIFNFTYWESVKNASSLVKKEEATYFSAGQDLMLRTATAYFNVLYAEDSLSLTSAQKKSLASLLKDTKERYQVGLIAITNVYQVQAQYDSITAQEIAAQNNLEVQREKLREIIGKEPADLAILGSKLTLVSPSPTDVGRWMATAEKQNYALLAARYATQAANDNIKVQAGGHIPIINATGGYQYSYDNNSASLGGLNVMKRNKAATVGLSLTLSRWVS